MVCVSLVKSVQFVWFLYRLFITPFQYLLLFINFQNPSAEVVQIWGMWNILRYSSHGYCSHTTLMTVGSGGLIWQLITFIFHYFSVLSVLDQIII